MQLPFSGKVAGMFASVEERQEKRVQQLRRLEEMSNRHREERLQQDQKRLHTLLMVQVHMLNYKEIARNKGSVVLSQCHASFFCSVCRSCWRREQWSSFTDDSWS